MMLKQKVTIFNPDTGLILDQREKSLYNPFDPERGYNYRYKSITLKTYLDNPLPDVFNDAELGKLFRLTKFIYADSNLLGKRTHSKVKALTQREIISIFGLKDRQGKSLLKKFIENQIIRKLEYQEKRKKHVQYYVNPLYFFSGTYLNLNLFLLFQDELVEHLPEWVILKFLEQAEQRNVQKS